LLVRKAIEFDPVLVQARRNLALVLEDQGRWKEAAEALQRAVQAAGPQLQYQDLAQELRTSGTVSSPPRP